MFYGRGGVAVRLDAAVRRRAEMATVMHNLRDSGVGSGVSPLPRARGPKALNFPFALYLRSAGRSWSLRVTLRRTASGTDNVASAVAAVADLALCLAKWRHGLTPEAVWG